MSTSNSLKRIENLHIIFWLIKDLCWCMLSRELGMMMVAPTIGVAIYIAYASRKSLSEFIHNLAVVCWISANSVWMIGEFFFNDKLRPIAIIVFILGLVSIAGYYSWFLFFKKVEKTTP